jgi:hypothetical protein
MYGTRKNALENREITLILKGEMSFATETSLASGRRVVDVFRDLRGDLRPTLPAPVGHARRRRLAIMTALTGSEDCSYGPRFAARAHTRCKIGNQV